MSLKALVTTLVLAATSTAALADPVVRDHRDDSADVARDHRDGDDFHKRPSWMVLAPSTTLARGRDIIATNTRLSTVKLVALKGTTTIRLVTIKFANGATQKVRLGQTIAPRSAPVSISLDGGLRNVVSIVVTGSSNRRASFEVLGA